MCSNLTNQVRSIALVTTAVAEVSWLVILGGGAGWIVPFCPGRAIRFRQPSRRLDRTRARCGDGAAFDLSSYYTFYLPLLSRLKFISVCSPGRSYAKD